MKTELESLKIDQEIIDLLNQEKGDYVVHLVSRQQIIVANIAWGKDLGDIFSHITTNISPRNDKAVEFFYTNEVTLIELGGEKLYAVVKISADKNNAQ